MKKEERFFNKITIIFTVISILVIVITGCVFLTLENINKATVIKAPNYSTIENSIDKLNDTANEAPTDKYSPEIFGQININTADKDELMLLSGIGNVKADAIIAHRTSSPFKKIEDIMAVKGIGKKTFENIKDSICVN